ncbi:MAG: universal stress protein [Verrucomicrobiales bacterium]|jgi:nucleotide-binding universal stress UspA family protein|nr:universal stress protein [Verrucomicrobiales bacterium]
MYQHILIPLENGPADRVILDHIRPLARIKAARLLLVHVADGFAARNYRQLNLAESDEIKQDREYLAQCAAELRDEGFVVEYVLALGEPADEIIKLALTRDVDLIAMSTHGHKFWGDLFFGKTADKVRHAVSVPVLLLKAPR